MQDFKFVINQPVPVDESIRYEFKEVKGPKPINTIKNTADEYVVAFLNRRIAGSIFWGIRDSDRCIVGIGLQYAERDKLRQEIFNKLLGIQPSMSPAVYSVPIHEVFESADHNKTISDL